ncbi:hypothetical protein EW026_g4150 [Hermanssonia centrifuga]|uniref:Uncharacterized protein n=1 Tax=Hermanssonia centrifuga TaxID=98765 RepID=A0A4V3XAF3_9APHY|nr:hypothetical protein EW026_g4150 [Hermanssonia centrifuga]
MPGGWPSHTPYHPQQAMPAMPGGGFGGAASAPAPPPSNTAATHHRPSRSTELADKIDKFSEDPIYGPVLDAFLVKVVKARIEMNPLLAPPPDKLDERPYLKWNLVRIEGYPIKQVKVITPDFGQSVPEEDVLKATWLGHAGFMVQLPRVPGLKPVRILFDPIWSERASPHQSAGPRRRLPPPCTIEELPDFQFVVTSHNQ